MYDWSAEGYDAGMDIDIEILLDDTVGTRWGWGTETAGARTGCGWTVMLI